MGSGRIARWARFGLLSAPLLLVGCSSEPINEPWVNPQQRERLEGQLERNEETATELRDRLIRSQADR